MNIEHFLISVIRQEADNMRKILHPDAVIRWHCTNECFTTEEYIRANCEYPGNWHGEIERIVHAGGITVAACRVWSDDSFHSFHVTSFIEISNDKIVALDEYWADDGDAPQWRKAMRIGKKIHEPFPGPGDNSTTF